MQHPVTANGHLPQDRSPDTEEETGTAGETSPAGDGLPPWTAGRRQSFRPPVRRFDRPGPGRWAGWALVALILLGAFAALAWKVHIDPDRFSIDVRVEDKLRTTVLDRHHRAMRLVAALGGPAAMATGMGIMALLSWRARDRRRLKLSVLAPLSAVAASVVTKPLVGRLLGFSFSFPSGHTTAAAALAATALVVCFDLTGGRAERRPLWPTLLWRRPDDHQPAHRLRGRWSPLLAKVTGLILFGAAAMAPIGVAVAVAVLRWHVISDSVGGLLLGPAMVAVTTTLCVALVPVDRPAVASVALRRVGYVTLAAGVVALGSVRLPYFILRPGSLIPLNESVLVELDGDGAGRGGEGGGERTPAGQIVNGRFSGLTVRTVRLTFGEWLWHDVNNSLDPIVTLHSLIPPGVDGQEYRDTQLRVFVDAGQIAAAVAETALGEEVVIEGDGVLITAVQAGAPADGHLAVGEVITAINGRPVRSENDLRVVLADLGQGAGLAEAPTELTVLDTGGTTRTELVTLVVLASTGRLGLGVGVSTQGLRFDLPVGVSIEGRDVGGPSAGLLTALTVYDVLSGTDLANGRHVTGTGTLSLDGRVGPIGGLPQKVLGAVAAQADVFVAPAEQAEEARDVAAGRIEVVGVATFEEAVAALSAAG